MKKWLITYLFIVCNICFHISGFAKPAKTNRTTSAIKYSYTTVPRVLTFKKPSLALSDRPVENSSDILFQHHGLQILYPVASYFIAEPNLFIRISCHVPGEMTRKKEIERVLRDYLLHLFPSHYFW